MQHLPPDVAELIVEHLQREGGARRVAQVLTDDDADANAIPVFEVQIIKAPAVRALLCVERGSRLLTSRVLRALAWRSLPENDLADEFAVYVAITNR